MKTTASSKAITLKTLTKNTVWDVQENDLFRMFESAEKDTETKDNVRYYINIAKGAFMIEELNEEIAGIKAKYEKIGYKTGHVRVGEEEILLALKKRPIARVSDLTYENIRHISAAKLIEVLERNFGGGWDSLSQSVKDIIESGFDISTTTLPKDRLHKKGGMYEKKVDDGYEVLEIAKGAWVEAIFAKLKPEMEKPRMNIQSAPNEDVDVTEDTFNRTEEDDDMQEPSAFEEDDDMNEENYRTTFAISGDDEEETEEINEYDSEE